MKLPTTAAAAIALSLWLAGCGDQREATSGEAGGQTSAVGKSSAAQKQGAGVGTVTAIDPAGGSVKLDHGAIAELGWPAMEMSFAANSDQLANLKVGDKVEFEFNWADGKGTVTSIRPAP